MTRKYELGFPEIHTIILPSFFVRKLSLYYFRNPFFLPYLGLYNRLTSTRTGCNTTHGRDVITGLYDYITSINPADYMWILRMIPLSGGEIATRSFARCMSNFPDFSRPKGFIFCRSLIWQISSSDPILDCQPNWKDFGNWKRRRLPHGLAMTMT